MSSENDYYWKGTYGVLVPDDCYAIPYKKENSMMYQNGSVKYDTEFLTPEYTEKEYKRKFAEYKSGLWYWKGSRNN